MAPLGQAEPERARPVGPDGHARTVHFYNDDAGLIDVISDFLARALRRKAGCVVFATKAHRDALESRLKQDGFDLIAARLLGKYITLDAAESLAHILLNGSPSAERFADVVGGALRRAGAGGRHVYVVRGMVPLLWADGRHDLALRCQELWDDEIAGDGLSVFTAFPVKNPAGQDNQELYERLCREHIRMTPPTPPHEASAP